MTSEEDFHEEMLSLYRRTGEATGYWPSYFLRAVRARGGLAVAKQLLAPGKVSSGFDKLIEVRRADLSVEHIILEPRYSDMFSEQERQAARDRLASLPPDAFPVPSVLTGMAEEAGVVAEHQEGSVRRITINAYERDPKARLSCIQHYGTACAVCDLDFSDRYGPIGKGFIHVHHKRPLSSLKASYRVDPKNDLVPVCPNCHAMLHQRDPPYDVEQLRAIIRSPRGS